MNWKQQWPLFVCTAAVAATMIACTLSIKQQVRRSSAAYDVVMLTGQVAKQAEVIERVEEKLESVEGRLMTPMERIQQFQDALPR